MGKRIHLAEPPLCKCGCSQPVTWDYSQQGWHVYAKGHYRRDALYKHEDWLRAAYESGRSINDICAQLSVTRGTIVRNLVRFGIERRDSAEQQWGIDRVRNPGPQCELCGSRLGYLNELGVCISNGACRREYHRRYRERYRQEVELGTRKPYPAQRTIPHVYGLHFPGVGALKVGSSTHLGQPLPGAATSLRRKGLPCDDGALIWYAPGHHLTELYLLTSLSFSLPPKFQSKTRMSEWFDLLDIGAEEAVARLNEIYEAMPPIPVWLQKTETM